MDAQSTAEALALIQAQSQARKQITDLTQASVAAEVRTFTAWYSSAEITLLASRLAKITKAGQRQTATSTDTFASRLLRLLSGSRGSFRGPIDVSTGLRSGVALESVYGRLADNYRWLEATRGASVPEALLERPGLAPLERLGPDAVLDRVVLRSALQVDDNLSLAFRDQWTADLAEAPSVVVGYRRVIHPELSKSQLSCGLCIVASDRVYDRAELLPLHARCACSVAPLIGEPGGSGDPGHALNASDLKELYQRAGGTSAAALKKTKYRVAAHGELGPRLVFDGQHHRGPSEVEADNVIAPAA